MHDHDNNALSYMHGDGWSIKSSVGRLHTQTLLEVPGIYIFLDGYRV